MSFLELTFDLGALPAERAEEACFAAGALAVTLVDARDDAVLEPAPGEVRLWPATRLTALYAGDAQPSALAIVLCARLGLAPGDIATRMLGDRVWEREWLKDFHAMRFGTRLWVCPSHESVNDAAACIVRLDPGLAFGTGTHPTTALCLTWLDAHLEAGSEVIDYGCGSGILALAAASLGARRVQCFDIDPQALTATRENALRNDVADRVIVCEGDEVLTTADLLLANILSAPLCRLAARFAELVRPGGHVVLAGLMEDQVAEVTEAYRAWFDMRRFGARDDWVGLAGSRRHFRALRAGVAGP
jgi:ribosomal protein L11 methyltransferase